MKFIEINSAGGRRCVVNLDNIDTIDLNPDERYGRKYRVILSGKDQYFSQEEVEVILNAIARADKPRPAEL